METVYYVLGFGVACFGAGMWMRDHMGNVATAAASAAKAATTMPAGTPAPLVVAAADLDAAIAKALKPYLPVAPPAPVLVVPKTVA